MQATDFTALETDRLRLRRFAVGDVAAFLAYVNDPLVARYQSWESFTEQQARDVMAQQASLEPGRPGRWFNFAIELKSTHALAGHVALCVKADDARQAEIGFTLARAYQGQGFAGEAVQCVLEYAFATLGLHRIIAITDCENAPSVALLERLGLRREGHFRENIWFKGRWGDEYLYAMLRAEWSNRARVNKLNAPPA